jgi:hypothetical protein
MYLTPDQLAAQGAASSGIGLLNPITTPITAMKIVTGIGNALFGNQPRRMPAPPGGPMGMSSGYGPIKNLPPHMKRMIYTGIPRGISNQITHADMQEMKRRNMLPPGSSTQMHRKAVQLHQLPRRLNIARGLDLIYDPRGNPRPGVSENFYAGRPLLEGIGSLAPTPVTPETPASPTPDTGGFLTEAQELSTSLGIPIQQAIISLASSRGLDPNQFLNISSGGIGSIGPGS